MSFLLTEVRPGAYADSIVLMQLQSDLESLDGVLAAGVVMGAAVNLDLLQASKLLDSAGEGIGPEDLVIAVRAATEDQASAALQRVDALLKKKRSAETGDYRPRSLAAAIRLAPAARWVSISVPGRHAAALAQEALASDLSVFLYSDNVSVQDEVDLKTAAAARGQLLMGPDCGSAMIGGIGLGFTNTVRRGPIGLVSASGTGLQAITTRIHQSGAGVSHAIGTGGRDLSSAVGAATTRQALDLLARDAETRVVVLNSKPPDPDVGCRVLAQALHLGKPVVVYFSGSAAPLARLGNLRFASSLTRAADLAVTLSEDADEHPSSTQTTGTGYLRGLFAGGTLALEAIQAARSLLFPLHSNLAGTDTAPLADPTRSTGHTVLDLGADEYTVGRLHPMMDPNLRLERLRQEAADPQTGLLLLDVVLGRGAHPDPAAELVPVLTEVRAERALPVVILLLGTDQDEQGLDSTRQQLAATGAEVHTDLTRGLARAIRACAPPSEELGNPVESQTLMRPETIINVGLEAFGEDFRSQDIEAIQVDWRPAAGGDERLMAILEKMKT